MAWTPPGNWNVGNLVDGVFMNAQIRDNLLWLYNAPICALYHNTTQSAAAGETALDFNSEVADPDGMHSGNAEEIILSRNGIWLTASTATLSANATGYRYARIDGLPLRQYGVIGSSGAAVTLNVCGWQAAAAATQLKTHVAHNTSTLTVSADCHFEVQWIGGL